MSLLVTWPSGVEYRPLRDSLRMVEPHAAPLVTEFEGGSQRKRRSATRRVALFAMTWDWETPDYDAFRTFYQHTLVDGTRRFTMPIFDGPGGTYETRECQFKGMYEWNRRGLRWRVSAEILVFGGLA